MKQLIKFSSIFFRKLMPILLFLMFSSVAFAQNTTMVNKDSIGFQQAVFWAKKGENNKAKGICQYILKKYPQDAKTEILLGRLYSWEKQFDSARFLLKDVIAREPGNERVLNAIINVELWSGNLQQGLVYCDKGLQLFPKSEELLMKKAKLLNKKTDYEGASATLNKILLINPKNQEAIRYKDFLGKKSGVSSEKNRIGVSYRYDHFNNTYTPWNFSSLYFIHKSKKINISTSINYANRFHKKGIQYELNLYPRLSSSMRAYIGGAYSKDVIFPAYKVGAGLYHTLFKKTEIDVGVRYLNFSLLPAPIIIYTSAFSMSTPRFFGSIRSYFTTINSGLNQSYYLTGRYYLKNSQKNITLVLGSGLSPRDYFDSISNKSYNNPTKSLMANLGYQTSLFSRKNILKCSIGYETRKYFGNVSRNRISVGFGLERLF